MLESRFGAEKEKEKKKEAKERSVWKENYPFSSFVPSSRRGIGEPSSHYERKRLVIPQPDAGKRWRLKRRQANHLLDFPTRERRSDSKIFLSAQGEREGVAHTTESFALFEARKGSTIKRCSHSKVFVNIGSQRLSPFRLKARRRRLSSIVSFPIFSIHNFQ